MPRRKTRAVSMVVIWAFLLNGCAGWRVVKTTELEDELKDVRLVLNCGTVVDVQNAYARGDSLFGMTSGIEKEGWEVPASFAMADVLEIKTRQVSLHKTLAVAVGAVAVAAAVAAAVAVFGAMMLTASVAGCFLGGECI